MESATIAERMQKIQSVFKTGQGLAYDKNEVAINHFLTNENHLFESVAYEGVACGLAENDIDEMNGFNNWQHFLELNTTHSTQIHIGLGWALALKKQTATTSTPVIQSVMEARVFDGYGYVEGLFRKRIAILQRVIPEQITTNQQMGYDQGLGRSMWYNAKGEVTVLNEIISSFPPARLPDLWRGVGIAVGYVGGAKVPELTTLAASSNTFNLDFKVGLLLSQFSRFHSSNMDVTSHVAILKILNLDKTYFEQLYSIQLSKSILNTYVEYLQDIKDKLTC